MFLISATIKDRIKYFDLFKRLIALFQFLRDM